MIRVILLFLLMASPASAFMPMFGGGASPTPEACDCADNTTRVGTMNNSMESDTWSYSQGFTAPAGGTNVVITFRVGTINGDPANPSYSVYLDTDRNFSAVSLGNATGGNLAGDDDNTDQCVVITASSALSDGSQYYFLVASLDADYADRFYIEEGPEYIGANNTACTKSNSIDHSSGATCNNATVGEDLYFKVCVGAGCSCD